MPISITKKGRLNRDITPFHTAAINPNVAYLKALLAVGQQYGPDLDGWDVIHYAAACEGTGPLKHLLSMGVSPVILNKKKQMPLHCAAKAGREENVKVLLKAMQKHEMAMLKQQQQQLEREEADPEQGNQMEDTGQGLPDEPPPPKKRARRAVSKSKSALINAKAVRGKTALHYAAARSHTNVIEALLSAQDILVDAQTSASNKKLTPLIVACAKGYLLVTRIIKQEAHTALLIGTNCKQKVQEPYRILVKLSVPQLAL
ncbi:unnamed protein product [Gongylonema pulchrum]|uniref:ANK_REP_REGION domain-containing protein n=1 Tax=Gongylonema pulchrum TaxID=637853 RepID=A0A183DS13_9BILA|nr:unnamed protein product [Gongylonema pulchrum]